MIPVSKIIDGSTWCCRHKASISFAPRIHLQSASECVLHATVTDSSDSYPFQISLEPCQGDHDGIPGLLGLGENLAKNLESGARDSR